MKNSGVFNKVYYFCVNLTRNVGKKLRENERKIFFIAKNICAFHIIVCNSEAFIYVLLS